MFLSWYLTGTSAKDSSAADTLNPALLRTAAAIDE
jgi:hypothetical protein